MKTEENGNGFLEILLFAPPTLMIVLLTLNCVLAIRERSIILDAIRSGISEQAKENRSSPPHSNVLFTNDTVALQESRRRIVEAVTEGIGKNILRALDVKGETPANFLVKGYLVTADIDPASGALLRSSVSPGNATFPHNSPFSLEAAFPRYLALSVRTFLDSHFESEASRFPSSFAIPVTPPFGDENVSYLPTGASIVIEVAASSRALPFDALIPNFSNLNVVHEIAIFPVRNLLG